MFNVNEIRREILTMAYKGQSVHVGCAFSLVEIFSVLYGKFYKENNRENKIVLSKGHGVMAQYVCLNKLGIISKEEMDTYFKNGSYLLGLAEATIRGVTVSSGSLGHGLSVVVGMALASQIQNDPTKYFCIIGDGEANEGSIWEAIMFASHFKLKNLMVIVDSNKYQAMGKTSEIMDMLDFEKKLTSFGFMAEEVDGHNLNEIEKKIIKLFGADTNKPKAIIANTIKGKGVSFMENNNSWHYLRLNDELYNKAVNELKS